MANRSKNSPACAMLGDEVVISGIAGHFPKSDSVSELQENLFNKIDMVSDIKNQSHVKNSKRMGEVRDPTKFDPTCFDIDYIQAHRQIPGIRMVLERTYEAIIDAGINPMELHNTKTGVFVACSFTDSEEVLIYDKINANSYGLIGCTEAMLAIQIANWLKVTGPVYKLDSACSSSTYALQQAYRYMLEESLDYAIVAGVNLNLVHHTRTFEGLGMLAKDGRCKTFDESADGFVRSEAIVVCVLQKAKTSRRIYAQIVHAKTKCDGFKEEGLLHPSMKEQERLLKEFYQECEIAPQNIQFMECHGTGTFVGDVLEVGALDAVMCSGRTEPLLVGSVKSNMGHGESAAGLCSIVKLCIAYNTGYIPPNINFKKCADRIPALTEGRMQVVTDKHRWNRGLSAVNSFGFGGANAHVLLKKLAKEKEFDGLPPDDLPRLICVSGRTHAAVARILDSFEAKNLDVEEIRLWHAVHEHNIEGHIFRGFTLLKSSSGTGVAVNKDVRRFSGNERSVCYFYSNTWSQWTGLDTKLMRIPIFAAAIEKCHETLQAKGIDLKHIIGSAGQSMNILNSSICNIAVQIAFTNVLKAVGIEADNIMGHGVGEIACAYADDCLTIEQAMLVAYYQGLAFAEAFDVETDLDVNPEYYNEAVTKRYSKNQRVNNENPLKDTSGIGNNRKNDGEEIDTNNELIGAKLLESLETVISSPKARSKRWIPRIQTKGKDPNCEEDLCTADYFLRIFMDVKPGSFAEPSQEIPIPTEDCIQIVFTHRNLLKKLKNGNDSSEMYTQKKLNDQISIGLENIFETLGELFEAGCNPRLANLYPHVPFPVSQGTPMLSHLVKWDHREKWFTDPHVINKQKLNSIERAVAIGLEQDEYLTGHVVNGRILYPATGYLVLAWETLAQTMQKPYQDVPVVFENVHFERSTLVPTTGVKVLNVTLHRITGDFEISEGNSSVVTGRVYVFNGTSQNCFKMVENPSEADDATQYLSSDDFYKTFHLKGYGHSGEFQSITKCNVDGTYFEIKWNNNWVVFLDNLLQTLMLRIDTNNILLPTRIEKVTIDVTNHYNSLKTLADPKIIKAYGDTYSIAISTAGVEIRAVYVTPMISRPVQCTPVLENHVFVPFEQNKSMKLENALRVITQFILENMQTYRLKAVEIVDEEYKKNTYEPLTCSILNILRDQSLNNAELTVITDQSIQLPSSIIVKDSYAECENNNLAIAANLCEKPNILNRIGELIGNHGFVMSREKMDFPKIKFLNNYDVLLYICTGEEYLVLFREHRIPNNLVCVELNMDEEFTWIDKIKEQINEGGIIVVYSQDKCSGILGFLSCLRKEPGGENVRGFLIKDTSAPAFDPNLEFYKEQLEKNLTVNVYENGQWGSYRYMLLTDLQETEAVDNAYINIETIGDLNSLKWFEGSLNKNLQTSSDLLLISVTCASINFRDVVNASGKVKVVTANPLIKKMFRDHIQGVEFVGRTANGSRVIGLCDKAISNMVLAASNVVMAFPDEWSDEEAATVLIAYFTAYAALIVYGQLKRGQSVLIHSGLGGVGQALIQVALSYGCEIFTTVGSDEKRVLIKKLFPQIKDNHIGCSRDMSFEEMVRRETNGRGVNIVVNSLAEDLLLATARCVGFRGRFVEIGTFDIIKDTPVQMCFYDKEVSFHGLMLEFMNEEKFAGITQKIFGLIASGIISGTVRPLTYCIFNKNEVLPAYKYMSTGKNVGKVVIKIVDDVDNEAKSIKPLKMEAVRRYACDSNSVFILIGGLGGFGLELADWLNFRGAKKLLLVSRNGIVNGYQAWKLRNFISYGATVKISTDDVTTEEGCKKMLNMANAMGPVAAVFNLALVLKDLTLQHQTRDTFQAVYAPKASIAIHLDKLTRSLCPFLKDFVMFSSFACGRGNAGQTNYGLANSVMERLCEKRKEDGLPALAIQWGVIGDVGYTMAKEFTEFRPVANQNINSCFSTLEKFLKQDAVVVSSYVPVESGVKSYNQNGVDLIAKIMGISDLKSISRQMTLAELGMDSIVAVEIKLTLERNYDIFLSAKETRNLTFARLTEMLEAKQTFDVTETEVVKNIAEVSLITQIFTKKFGEENMAYKPFVFMPTAMSEKYNDGDVYSNSQCFMFMVPGLEGFAAIFKLLCEQLDTRVCVLQLGLDNLDEDILSMVERLFQSLKSHLNPNVPFNLLGYSFGTVLVLELAARLEMEGLKGTVYCIDGSPLWCKIVVDNISSLPNSSHLQNILIKKVMDFAGPGQNLYLKENIEEIEAFEDKIDYTLNNTLNAIQYSKDHLKRLIIAFHNRINAMLQYDITHLKKLKSPIILIRSKDEFVTLSDNYGLDMLTDDHVDVHFVNSDHVSIIESRECASIINQYLNTNNHVTG